MEKIDVTSVVAGLAALAQETRLVAFQLLVRAGRDGMPAGEIAGRLSVPPQTLSFHLKELLSAGLVASERDGRRVIYRVEFDRARSIADFLMQSCCAEPALRKRRSR